MRKKSFMYDPYLPDKGRCELSSQSQRLPVITNDN